MVSTKTRKKRENGEKTILPLLRCALCFIASIALSRVNVDGECQILAVAFVCAAGGNLYGFLALIGAVLGYSLFFNLSNTSLYIASALFIYTISYTMQFTNIYRYRVFSPFVAAVVLTTVLSFGDLSATRVESIFSWGVCLEVMLGALFSYLYSYSIRDDFAANNDSMKAYSIISLLVSLAISISDLSLFQSISLSRAVVLYVFLLACYLKNDTNPCIIGLICGLGLQISYGSTTELYLFLIYSLHPIFNAAVGKLLLSAYTLAVSAIYYIFTSAASFSFLDIGEFLIPVALFVATCDCIQKRSPGISIRQRNHTDSHYHRESVRLSFLADYMKSLSVARGRADCSSLEEANTYQIVDEICTEICENCDKLAFCKSDYQANKESFLPYADLQVQKRGRLEVSDLKDYFSCLCCYKNTMVTLVNRALRSHYEDILQKEMLLHSITQNTIIFGHTAELLQNTSEAIWPIPCPQNQSLQVTEQYTAAIGLASLKKRSESVCGDIVRYFKNDAGILTIILSDGVGSGSHAKSQSEQTVDTLEKLLYLTNDPLKAITLTRIYLSSIESHQLCSATIDLVTIDLISGEINFFKLGAADSYFIQKGEYSTLKGNPSDYDQIKQQSLQADAYTVVVLKSDGIFTTESELKALMDEEKGTTMKQIAKKLLLNYGDPQTDDCTVITICIQRKS